MSDAPPLGAESVSEPWGSKWSISVYVKGPASDAGDWIMASVENLVCPPGTAFVGLSFEDVQDEPQDQGAS
jgi:hypothetical protein